MSGCPVNHKVPQHLAHLRQWNGIPVPFTVAWADDVPDFRVVNPEHVRDCFVKRLCGVCGRNLGEFAYFIGGPQCKDHRLFADPPMHKDCAIFAAHACPFLNGSTKSYSNRETAMPTTTNEMMADKRPDLMFIMQAKTKKVTITAHGGRPYITAPLWISCQRF